MKNVILIGKSWISHIGHMNEGHRYMRRHVNCVKNVDLNSRHIHQLRIQLCIHSTIIMCCYYEGLKYQVKCTLIISAGMVY